MAFRIHACVNSFCGMENLALAMKLICLALIGLFLLVIPLVIVCYVESFFFAMNYISFATSIAAFVLSIIVILSLQLKVCLACHFFLNLIWWPVTFLYITSTLHVCVFYVIVKSPMLEPCPPEAIALLFIWMVNTLLMTTGMLVYWSMYVKLKDERAKRKEEAALRDEQTGPLSGDAEKNVQ
uniref:Uncharacterized protein n=1 Tax=Cacopsylla melanoneura TaxID=428564 RepID=A0A8D8QXF0_9HEMI